MVQRNHSAVFKAERLITAAITCVTAVFIACMFYLSSWNKQETGQEIGLPENVYPVHKIIRYSFMLRNKSNSVLKDAVFKTHAPVLQTGLQKTVKLDATSKYDLEKDSLGNQVMKFEIKNMAPYASKTITITAEVALAEMPNKIDDKNLKDYLKEEKYIETSNPEIKGLSERLGQIKNKPLPKTVFDWVSRNISDAGYLYKDYGALYALQKKKGDCTEYMYLSLALLRNNHIPARGIGGFVVENNGLLTGDSYHNWAEYYTDNEWHLLDAQKKVLDKDYANYIAFRIFGDSEKNALSQSQRFLAFDDRLEVRMN